MPLPKQVREEAGCIMADYCARKVPEHARHQVRMGFDIRSDSVTLVQARPHWQNPDLWIKSSIAQFRYDRKRGTWTLIAQIVILDGTTIRSSRRRTYEDFSGKSMMTRRIYSGVD